MLDLPPPWPLKKKKKKLINVPLRAAGAASSQGSTRWQGRISSSIRSHETSETSHRRSSPLQNTAKQPPSPRRLFLLPFPHRSGHHVCAPPLCAPAKGSVVIQISSRLFSLLLPLDFRVSLRVDHASGSCSQTLPHPTTSSSLLANDVYYICTAASHNEEET